MADVATVRSPADAIPYRPNPVWSFIRKEPLGFAGFLIILMYFVFALGAVWIAPYDPEAVDFTAMLAAPGADHLFGGAGDDTFYAKDLPSKLPKKTRLPPNAGDDEISSPASNSQTNSPLAASRHLSASSFPPMNTRSREMAGTEKFSSFNVAAHKTGGRRAMAAPS